MKRAQPTASESILGLAVLVSIGKEGEEAREQHSLVVSASVADSRFLR